MFVVVVNQDDMVLCIVYSLLNNFVYSVELSYVEVFVFSISQCTRLQSNQTQITVLGILFDSGLRHVSRAAYSASSLLHVDVEVIFFIPFCKGAASKLQVFEQYLLIEDGEKLSSFSPNCLHV